MTTAGTGPDLIGRAEVARRLSMSPARLRREVAAGTVPGPRPLKGRKQLWARADIDRWLAGPDALPSDPIARAIDHAIGQAG